MAQVQQPSTSTIGIRPTTPQARAQIKVPRLSPSRMPEQLDTSSLKNGHLNLDTFSPVNQNGSFEFDRVIKGGKILRRMKKKGAWKSSWKPAYLVLRPNLLSVYKNDDETDLRASITLSDVTAVARVKKSNTDNVFGVFTPAKNYHFSGLSAREVSDWVALIRIESRIGDSNDLDLAPPEFPAKGNNTGSDTTDLSAEDDNDQQGSPEGPASSGAVGSRKSRHGSTSQRKTSGFREYVGNENFTTSQSDLSDAMVFPTSSSNAPNTYARPKNHLLPVHDGLLSPSRSSFQRSVSQLSVTQVQTQQLPSQDPNRVIRQSHVYYQKPVAGTHLSNWKSVWAVLRPASLSLYKSSSEYEPIKILSVSELIDVAEIEPTKKHKGKGEFCFQIIGLEKIMRFSVENEEDLEGWIGSLKSVFAKRNRPRGHSASAIGSNAAMNGGQATVGLGQSLAHNPTQAYSQAGAPYLQGSLTGQARLSQQHIQRPESALDGIVEGMEEVDVK